MACLQQAGRDDKVALWVKLPAATDTVYIKLVIRRVRMALLSLFVATTSQVFKTCEVCLCVSASFCHITVRCTLKPLRYVISTNVSRRCRFDSKLLVFTTNGCLSKVFCLYSLLFALCSLFFVLGSWLLSLCSLFFAQ